MKILIAEDEVVNRKKLEITIKALGYEPIVAENGSQAWEIWQNERPSLVVSDWMMPEMDGPDLCRQIRKNEGSNYTYIILLTSRSDLEDLVSGMNSGADDYITKPFKKEELSARIKAGERILNIQTRDIVIFALAKLAESRDPETGHHLERIRHYSRVLAKTLFENGDFLDEIDINFIENIFLTSPLHDIGKVGIPDFVLLKAGKFDKREFEIMRTHTEIGYQTLNEALKHYPAAGYLQMSGEIALYHHEKVDGSGYPKGLKGKDVPLSARIVALSDVFDALVSKRVYKKAFPLEIARSIILEDKGTHFDSTIVDAFLKCEDQFVDIYKRYRD